MNKELIKLFGRDHALLCLSLELLIEDEKKQSYFFMNKSEYERISLNNLKYGNQIFWIELLSRVRFSSLVNLIRSKKWIDGIVLSLMNNNLLSFWSNLRGLIESGSDANYTFAAIPAFIIKELDDIKSVFNQDSPSILTCKPLEDALIHYSHAGSHIPRSDTSKVYNSKQIKTYIEYSDNKDQRLSKFYKFLSGYVHPSRESILTYLNINGHETGEYLTVEDADSNELEILIDNSIGILNRVFRLGVYPALLNLKALSLLEIDQLKIKYIDAFNFEDTAEWKQVIEMSKN